MEKEVKYYGEWQEGSVILEKLTGPIGNGRVEFPNGDSFEGIFHLSFACINGPCYAACGKYTFADGSYSEHAWINTSKDLSKFGLKGVYEVKNADGSYRDIAHPIHSAFRTKLENAVLAAYDAFVSEATVYP